MEWFPLWESWMSLVWPETSLTLGVNDGWTLYFTLFVLAPECETTAHTIGTLNTASRGFFKAWHCAI